MSARQVARPAPSAEAVLNLVRKPKGLVVVLKALHRDEGTEHLLAGHAATLRGKDHRGLDVVAAPQRRVGWRLTPRDEGAALALSDCDVGEYAITMRKASERSQLGLGRHRIANPDPAGESYEAVEKLICDALLQQKPRAGDTCLALIVEDGERRATDGGFEIGVLEDDVGPLPAELELDPLQIAGARSHNATPYLGRTGERHLVDAGMLGDPLPR